MKKHHFIKMSSIALSLCVALGTFPATAFADDANATTITKAYQQLCRARFQLETIRGSNLFRAA